MKLHIMSDLHLDFTKMSVDDIDFNPESILLLAGDLGEQKLAVDFVIDLSKKVKHTIWIMGNHEYYSGDLNKTVDIIKADLEAKNGKSKNITVTDQAVVEIDDVVFICATLWTDFLYGNELIMQQAKSYMADYTCILDGNRLVTPNTIYWIHLRDVAFIEDAVKEHKGKKIVLMTHTAPSAKSIDEQYRGGQGNEFFYSPLDYIMEGSEDIVLWVHGHTHASMDYMVHKTHVICNPRGYTSKYQYRPPENLAFDKHLIEEI